LWTLYSVELYFVNSKRADFETVLRPGDVVGAGAGHTAGSWWLGFAMSLAHAWHSQVVMRLARFLTMLQVIQFLKKRIT
jgi:hypothetical protein